MTSCFSTRRRRLSALFCVASVLWITAIGPTQAADCRGSQRWPVENAICRDDALRALDSRVDTLAERLAAAKSTDAEAVPRDQVNWRATLRAAGWQALELDRDMGQALEPYYRRRIAYLNSRLQPGSSAPAPLARLQNDLKTINGPVNGGLIEALATHDPAIKRIRPSAETRAYDHSQAAFDALRVKPDAALSQAARSLDEPTDTRSIATLWAPEARVGALYTREGSAGCMTSQWFAAQGDGAARAIATPPILARAPSQQTHCVTSAIEWLVIDGRRYVARIDDQNVDQTTLWLQRYANDAWQNPRGLVVRFDHTIGDAEVICQSKDHCDLWTQVARPIAAAFDHRPEPGFNAAALAPRQRDRLEHMMRLARQAESDASTPAPLIDNDRQSPLGPYDQFASTAVYFPVSVGHHWILGRIGRAHRGWRQDDDWLIGFWNLPENQTELVPMASVRLDVQRTRYLGSTVLSNKPES